MLVGLLSTLNSYNSRQASTFATASRSSLTISGWESLLQLSLLLLLVTPSLAAPSLTARQEDVDAQQPADTTTTTTTYDRHAYLPAQIGGIVGSYAVSLVLVAVILLLLSKKRREHLAAGENEVEFLANVNKPQYIEPEVEEYPQHWAAAQQEQEYSVPASPRSIPRSPVVLGVERDYSPAASLHHPANAWPLTVAETAATRSLFRLQTNLPSHTSKSSIVERSPYVAPSPTSTIRSPLGIDETVDQSVVQHDRDMAQTQLEEMYKYVMEHEEAKKRGMEPPPIPYENASGNGSSSGGTSRPSTAGGARSSNALAQRPSTSGASISSKKERAKPAALNLAPQPEPEKKSRTSSLFSALRSPRKNKMQGVSISSPIMTPMSGTFPRESQEMSTIPPRQYAPAAPPPVPNQLPFRARGFAAITPEQSPNSSQSIDERLSAMPANRSPPGHAKNNSSVSTMPDTHSAVSESSQTPLVGLPSSPKPGATFPSLPASPKPGQSFPSLPLSPKPGATFSRANAPSAVRTGGSLPLRAYEPPLASPSATSQQIKQTVFDRVQPLSPMGARTPFTGAAVPYSPYQPFSPCVPVTPSLVTRADRKRMRRLEPKTPTLELVKSTEDLW